MSELKPCPFCGAKAGLSGRTSDERSGYARTVTAACQACGASVSTYSRMNKAGWIGETEHEQNERTLAAWNRRAEPVPPPAQEAPGAVTREEIEGMPPPTSPDQEQGCKHDLLPVNGPDRVRWFCRKCRTTWDGGWVATAPAEPVPPPAQEAAGAVTKEELVEIIDAHVFPYSDIGVGGKIEAAAAILSRLGGAIQEPEEGR